MAPLVSVVVTVHDGERYVGAAIESILAQGHRPLEVVVVDNGSTDASGAIAGAFGEPVRVVRQEDRVPAGGRNRGILESRGDYVAFLDADDLYRPAKLSLQLAHLEADPELAACLCIAENFWEAGLEDERERYVAAGKLRATHTFATMLARREIFDRVGLLKTTSWFGDQIEWFLRLADAGLPVLVLPEVLVDRRMHASSLTHTSKVADSYLEIVADRISRARRASQS